MTLTDARAGSRVTFRNGGTATIKNLSFEDGYFNILFEEDEVVYTYHQAGLTKSHIAFLDIVAISPAPMNQGGFPILPKGWFLVKIEVRRDWGWCLDGTLTYDALLEREGDYAATGCGPDPISAVKAAIALATEADHG